MSPRTPSCAGYENRKIKFPSGKGRIFRSPEKGKGREFRSFLYTYFVACFSGFFELYRMRRPQKHTLIYYTPSERECLLFRSGQNRRKSVTQEPWALQTCSDGSRCIQTIQPVISRLFLFLRREVKHWKKYCSTAAKKQVTNNRKWKPSLAASSIKSRRNSPRVILWIWEPALVFSA